MAKRDQQNQEPVTSPEPTVPTGAPAAPAPAVAPPTGQRLTIAGREFENVSPELMDAIQEREQQFNAKMGETSADRGDIRRMREQITRLETAHATPTPVVPELLMPVFDSEKYNSLIYDNPAEAHRMRETYDQQRFAYMEQRQDRQIQAVRDEYSQDQQRRDRKGQWDQFVDNFYVHHKDLDGMDDLVDGVFKAKQAEVIPLYTEGRFQEAYELVATGARQKLLKYVKGTQQAQEPTTVGGRMAVVEGGGGPARERGVPAVTPEEEDEGHKTISSVIRAKKARHMGAHKRRPRPAE